VYIITNLITGKKYVGDHSTDNLNDNYLGGGLYLKQSIKKYGKQNFKKDIIQFFDTKEDAFIAQEKYINENNTLIPNGYNISPKGGNTVKDCHSEETKLKISESNKGRITHFKDYNHAHKKGKSYLQQMIEIYGEEIGVIKAEEYKNKISVTTQGDRNPNFGNGYKVTGCNNGMYGKTGANKGKKFSEETKQRMSLAAKELWQKRKQIINN
jgi:hypothetical protein